MATHSRCSSALTQKETGNLALALFGAVHIDGGLASVRTVLSTILDLPQHQTLNHNDLFAISFAARLRGQHSWVEPDRLTGTGWVPGCTSHRNRYHKCLQKKRAEETLRDEPQAVGPHDVNVEQAAVEGQQESPDAVWHISADVMRYMGGASGREREINEDSDLVELDPSLVFQSDFAELMANKPDLMEHQPAILLGEQQGAALLEPDAFEFQPVVGLAESGGCHQDADFSNILAGLFAGMPPGPVEDFQQIMAGPLPLCASPGSQPALTA